MRSIAVILIILLIAPTGMLAQVAPLEAQPDAWNIVQDLPQGTRVKLIFRDGTDVTGSVVDARADAVMMNNNQTRSNTLPVSTGTSVSVARAVRNTSLTVSLTFLRSDVEAAVVERMATRYSAGGKPPNAGSVRHVVTAFGVGKKIEVQTSQAQKWRGRITAIEEDGFTLTRGMTPTDEHIAYAATTDVKPAGLNKWVKIGIAGGTATGLVFLFAFLNYVACGCD